MLALYTHLNILVIHRTIEQLLNSDKS